jgi:predicted kinase
MAKKEGERGMIIVSQTKKTLIIMRGLPGSGKSTRAKALAAGGEIFSTDNFFMKGGKYVYNPALIGKAHEWNQNAAIAAMIQGVSPVVIDNTNVRRMHVEPYIQAAKKLGYEIQVAEPDSPWWKKHFKRDMTPEDKTNLVKELMSHGTHDVPEAAITKMIDGWEHDFEV